MQEATKEQLHLAAAELERRFFVQRTLRRVVADRPPVDKKKKDVVMVKTFCNAKVTTGLAASVFLPAQSTGCLPVSILLLVL